MSSTEQSTLQPVTRARWAEIVTNHVSDQQQPPPVKRHEPRQAVEGFAKLTITIVRTCTLLQVSEGGLMVRSPKEIPVGTRLSIESYLHDEAVLLSGEVVHCTETVGAFKVGVQLSFDG